MSQVFSQSLFENVPRASRLDLVERRVFVRADLNVPLSPGGDVVDDAHLRMMVPGLVGLVQARCKVIVGAHYGTPERPAPPSTPVRIARRLGELVGSEVTVLGPDFAAEISGLAEGQIALTPNLLNYPQEVAGDARWARKIARSIDVYLNDDLRAARETWASVTALPRALPSRAVGMVVGSELDWTRDMVDLPAPPFTLVLGSTHFARRVEPMCRLLERTDTLLLGGETSRVFLVAEGWWPGASKYDREAVAPAREILAAARAAGVDVRFPKDQLVSSPDAAGTSRNQVPRALESLSSTEAAVDLGPDTVSAYREVLARSNTVVVAGLMGDCTSPDSCNGTLEIVRASTSAAPYTLLVGQKAVEMAAAFDVMSRFRFIASCDDASLELLSGTAFPGLESLRT